MYVNVLPKLCLSFCLLLSYMYTFAFTDYFLTSASSIVYRPKYTYTPVSDSRILRVTPPPPPFLVRSIQGGRRYAVRKGSVRSTQKLLVIQCIVRRHQILLQKILFSSRNTANVTYKVK